MEHANGTAPPVKPLDWYSKYEVVVGEVDGEDGLKRGSVRLHIENRGKSTQPYIKGEVPIGGQEPGLTPYGDPFKHAQSSEEMFVSTSMGQHR